ncbi:MAG: hypothetical protein ACTSPV_18495 [Candidatus Hodarchaeales archaeon]
MERQEIPPKILYFISGIWIIQMISLFLPFRVQVPYNNFQPMTSSEFGLEQPTLIFFFLASIFTLVTLYFGQKKWLVWNILTSIVFIWPAYISLFVKESFSMWSQGFEPLYGAYIYLLGVFLNICILVYWWKKEKELTIEPVPLSPLKKRTLGLTVYIGLLACLTQRHPVNLLLQDLFPYLTRLIVLVESSTVLLILIFVGQVISGLWLILNYSQSVSFSKIVNFRYFAKLGLVWLMLGFIIATLNHFEYPQFYGYNMLAAFLGTVSLLLFEVITWFFGFTIQPHIQPSFQYLRQKLT